MPKPPLKNPGASVRARLLNLARARKEPFDRLLTRYVLERLLYRLSLSPHRARFVLKGAMLVTTCFADAHRPTRDVDFLGFGPSDPATVLGNFKEIAAVAADDPVTLPRAIKATFARRKTDIPVELPDALTQAFANDPAKQKQWADFVTQLDHAAPGLNEVIADVAAFLMPQAERART